VFLDAGFPEEGQAAKRLSAICRGCAFNLSEDLFFTDSHLRQA
jgi:hypothetical protein